MKTLKAVVAKYNQTSLILRILIGWQSVRCWRLFAPGAGWSASWAACSSVR